MSLSATEIAHSPSAQMRDAASWTTSRTVSSTWADGFCSKSAIILERSLAPIRARSRLPSHTRPMPGLRSPASKWSRVVLPDPLRPIIIVII